MVVLLVSLYDVCMGTNFKERGQWISLDAKQTETSVPKRGPAHRLVGSRNHVALGRPLGASSVNKREDQK